MTRRANHHLTEAERWPLKPLPGRLGRQAKYRNKKTLYNGQLYDSNAEACRAADLNLLVKTGEINHWERGRRQTVLNDGYGNKVTYKPDFIVWDTPVSAHVEDVKGAMPRDFRIRAILWGIKFPNLPLKVIDKDGTEIWKLKR